MFVPRLRLPSGPILFLLDLLVLGWVVLFAFLGVLVYDAVQELAALSTSVTTAGGAVNDTGRAIGSLDVPLVGGVLGGVGQEIQEAGRSVIGTAATAREGIDRLALITGLLVAILPSLPLLAYYGPPRLVRAREARAVAAVLEDGAGDPLLERFLAERAAMHLSFRELRRVSIRPWRDIEEGRVGKLAAAELRRVGVSPGLLARSRR